MSQSQSQQSTSFSSRSSSAACGPARSIQGSSAVSLSGRMRGRVSTGWVPSMYGGAGGFGTRIAQSSCSSSSSSSSMGGTAVMGDEKLTMQNLNDRLACYLEKVRSLEEANRKLEQQIRQFNEKRANATPDYSAYYCTIDDLRAQIAKKWSENQSLILQIDNSRLAAEDFKTKYEFELHLHKVVEADVLRLRGVRDCLTLTISDLEMQIENLKEELACMKTTHKEEVAQLKSQQSGSVNVEVDTPCSVDLQKVLDEVREQYQNVVKKNKQDLEKWFQSKVETLQKNIAACETEVQTYSTEVAELKRTYQTLQITRQSLQTEMQFLQNNLKEVNTQYSAQLNELQACICNLESELQQLKASTEQQQACYKQLLDVKMRLEMEIAEYRRLLEGDQCQQRQNTAVVVNQQQQQQQQQQQPQQQQQQQLQQQKQLQQKAEDHKPHIERRVKTVVEQVVDGQVVSSSVDTQVETIQ